MEVRSVSGLPETIFSHEGVCEDEEFSHCAGNGDFWEFTPVDEAIVEGFDVGVVLGCAVGGHVESGWDMLLRPPRISRLPAC